MNHQIRLYGRDAAAIKENSIIVVKKVTSVEGRDVVILEVQE